MNASILVVSAVLIAGTTTAVLSRGASPQGKQGSSVVYSKRVEQTAWGIAGDPTAVSRTVTLSITERIRLTPDDINVLEGETLRILLTNNGTQTHEFVMGTRQELEEHAARMVRYPDQVHDEPYIAQIPAGKTGEIVWTFNKTGSFEFSCPLAGHYQSGTVGKIHVATAR